MKKRCYLFALLVFVLFLGLTSFVSQHIRFNNPQSQIFLVDHPKIYISGETALDLFPNKTGSGTSYNPYVIADYEINAGALGSAVEIHDVFNRYFVLNDLIISNSGTNESDYDSGIKIYNCRNFFIRNCEISNTLWGISILDSLNYELRGNTIINNDNDGIVVEGSNNVLLTNNTINTMPNSSGIHLLGSTVVTISYNNIGDCENGVKLEDSEECEITGNVIEECSCGIHLEFSNENEISQNMIGGCDYGILLSTSNYNLISKNQFNENGEDYQEIDSIGNEFVKFRSLVSTILIWCSVGVVLLTVVILCSIYLPRSYKKRAPIREKRRQQKKSMREQSIIQKGAKPLLTKAQDLRIVARILIGVIGIPGSLLIGFVGFYGWVWTGVISFLIVGICIMLVIWIIIIFSFVNDLVGAILLWIFSIGGGTFILYYGVQEDIIVYILYLIPILLIIGLGLLFYLSWHLRRKHKIDPEFKETCSCLKCGALNPQNAKYCAFCGAKIS